MQFKSRLIEQGRVIGYQRLELAERPGQDLQTVRDAAYREAHDGIDPFSGRWVEVTPAREDAA